MKIKADHFKEIVKYILKPKCKWFIVVWMSKWEKEMNQIEDYKVDNCGNGHGNGQVKYILIFYACVYNMST